MPLFLYWEHPSSTSSTQYTGTHKVGHLWMCFMLCGLSARTDLFLVHQNACVIMHNNNKWIKIKSIDTWEGLLWRVLCVHMIWKTKLISAHLICHHCHIFSTVLRGMDVCDFLVVVWLISYYHGNFIQLDVVFSSRTLLHSPVPDSLATHSCWSCGAFYVSPAVTCMAWRMTVMRCSYLTASNFHLNSISRHHATDHDWMIDDW